MTDILNLPGWTVLSVKETEYDYKIEAEALREQSVAYIEACYEAQKADGKELSEGWEDEGASEDAN